jgi:benzoylformate decarboxylase
LHSFGRHFGLNNLQGTDLDGLDFVRLAEGQGVSAVRVTDTAALIDALAASFGNLRPTLIEVQLDE